jgi:hypothetical protein
VPQIPQYLAREQLPTSSGVRGGVVNVPVVGQPGADTAGGAVLEKALGALPEAIESAGALQVKTEELQQHRQKAFDTINAKTQHQEWRLEMQPTYETLRQGDWQTLPERVEEEGKRLIEKRSQNLSPYAKALFEEDAKQSLAVFQQRAIEERIKRTEQATTFTFARELQQGQEALAKATNDYERQVAQGQLEETAKRFVDTGLVDGAKVAAALKQTKDAVAEEQVRTAIQADPANMRLQLQAQAKIASGVPDVATDPNLPLAPPEKLAELTQYAWEIEHQRLAQQEHAEVWADRRLAKEQEQTAADLRARLTTILPTPENVAQYDALLAEVNQKAQGAHPAISGTHQQEFTNHIRTLRAAALHPREVDDGPTERRLTILLDAADNERDYNDVRAQVIQNAGMLKPETMKGMLSTIYERKQSGHYSQLHGYREGIRVIMGGDIAEGNYMAMLRGTMQEAEQVRLRNALDAYRAWAAETAKTSRDQVNSEGPIKALELRHTYMDVPDTEAKARRLPLPLLGRDGKTPVQDRAEAIAIISKLPGTDASRQRVLQQWDDWRKGATPPATTTTPPSGGRQKVPQ